MKVLLIAEAKRQGTNDVRWRKEKTISRECDRKIGEKSYWNKSNDEPRKHNNDKQCLETVDCPDYYSKRS